MHAIQTSGFSLWNISFEAPNKFSKYFQKQIIQRKCLLSKRMTICSDLFRKYLACILCAEGVSELFVCRKLCTGTQRKKDQASPTSINCPHFLSFWKSNKRAFYLSHVLIYSIVNTLYYEILIGYRIFQIFPLNSCLPLPILTTSLIMLGPLIWRLHICIFQE